MWFFSAKQKVLVLDSWGFQAHVGSLQKQFGFFFYPHMLETCADTQLRDSWGPLIASKSPQSFPPYTSSAHVPPDGLVHEYHRNFREDMFLLQ